MSVKSRKVKTESNCVPGKEEEIQVSSGTPSEDFQSQLSRHKLPEGWTPMTSHLQPRNGSPGPASGNTKIHIQAEAKISYSSPCSSKQTSKRQED